MCFSAQTPQTGINLCRTSIYEDPICWCHASNLKDHCTYRYSESYSQKYGSSYVFISCFKKIPWMIKSMICHLEIAEWLIKTNWSITHKKGESTARSKMHHTFYSFIWPNNFTFYENHLFIYLVKSGNIFLHLCFRLFTWKTLLEMGSFYFYII